MADPNEVPQEMQDGQDLEATQQPAVDPRLALEIASQQFGVTPEFLEGAVRLQDENRRVAEEIRRRQHEIELREAKAEALLQSQQRYQPPPPSYDDLDPVTRKVLERLDRIDQREEQRIQAERQREESNRRVMETANALDRHYNQIMRGVPSQNQIDQDRFFNAMGEIYPTSNGELPPGITPEKAVFNTAKYLGINVGTNGGFGGGYGAPRPSMRDPRAQFVVPTQGTGPSASDAVAGPDFGAQRQGESTEQYHARLKRSFQESGFSASGLVPDKGRISSG